MSFNPKVSIIIPVYNGVNYVRRAIDSALSQTYQNIEIVVVNDGSKDNTEEICKSYGDKIRYIKKKNGGVSTALNLGISKMTGDYFSWLSHDDEYDINKIEYQVNALRGLDDKKTVIGCSHLFIDHNSEILYRDKKMDNRDEYDTTHSLKYLFSGYVHGCDLLIHKDIFKDVGVFNEKLPTTQDFDLWFRIFKKYKLYSIPDYLVFSRSHEDQGSKAGISKHVLECDELWIGFDEKLSDDEKASIYGSLGMFYKEIYRHLISGTLYEGAKKYYRKKYIQEISKDLSLYDDSENLFPMELKELSPLLSDKDRPRLFFPIYGTWSDRGGLTRIVSVIMNELVKKYDVYLMSYGDYEVGYDLDPNIKKMVVKYEDVNNEKVLNLQLLLGIDVYIGTINCMAQFFHDYSYCKEYGIKTIAWNHEYYFLPHYDLTYWVDGLERNHVYKDVDIVLWLNSFSAFSYKQFNNNGMVLRNPLSIKYSDKKQQKKYNNELIAVGRFDDPIKNLDLLLHVFANVLKSKPDAILNVLGRYDLDLFSVKYQKTIKEIIDELELNDKNLKFMGEVSNPEFYYNKSSINLMTSYWEGFGLIINEAALFKVPSVVFDGSGFEDLIDNGESGYIVKKGDIDKYASKIVDLLSDSKKLKLFGDNAFARTKHYELSEVMSVWYDLIDNVMKNDDITDYINTKYPIVRSNELETASQIIQIYHELFEKMILENISLYNGGSGVASGFMGLKSGNKLVRWIKTFARSLKRNGVRITVVKIKNKIKKKLLKK